MSILIWKYATEFWPLHLAYAAYLIHLNFLDQAFSQLQLLPSRYSDCLEVLRLKSRILEKQQRFDEALLVLERCSVRFPSHLPVRIQELDTAVKGRSQDKTLPILNSLTKDFGYPSELLTLASQIRLLQSRPSDARHIILRNRIWNSIRQNQNHLLLIYIILTNVLGLLIGYHSVLICGIILLINSHYK